MVGKVLMSFHKETGGEELKEKRGADVREAHGIGEFMKIRLARKGDTCLPRQKGGGGKKGRLSFYLDFRNNGEKASLAGAATIKAVGRREEGRETGAEGKRGRIGKTVNRSERVKKRGDHSGESEM